MISHTYSYLGALLVRAHAHPRAADRVRPEAGSFLPLIFHIADQIFSFPAVPVAAGRWSWAAGPTAAIAEAIAEERATALWAGSPAMLRVLVAALTGART